jgi:hypothetical protein
MYWERIWFTARRLAHGRGVFFCLRRNPVRSTPLCSEIWIHPPNDRVARGTKCACISLITSSDNSSAALVAERGSASDKGDRGAANLSRHCTRDRAPLAVLVGSRCHAAAAQRQQCRKWTLPGVSRANLICARIIRISGRRHYSSPLAMPYVWPRMDYRLACARVSEA